MKKSIIKYTLELIILVTGISLSFWISEWDNNRNMNSRQQHYLNGLKNDLEKQIILFDDYEKFTKNTIENAELILNIYESIGSLSKIDSLNTLLTGLMYSSKFPEINTTFNELESTAQFYLIKDDELISTIIKYYQNSRNVKDRVNSNIDIVYYKEIFPVIKSSIVINPKDYGYEGSKINLINHLRKHQINRLDSEKEFELINAISLSIVVANTNGNYTYNIKDEAEILLRKINIKLNEK